jgi:hypothetical protein
MLKRSNFKTSTTFKDPSPWDSTAQYPMPGPFGREAFKAWQYGLAVLPCGGEDGKRPLIKWKGITGPQPEHQINASVSQPSFKSANLGIITGASNLTVIDCDTPGNARSSRRSLVARPSLSPRRAEACTCIIRATGSIPVPQELTECKST